MSEELEPKLGPGIKNKCQLSKFKSLPEDEISDALVPKLGPGTPLKKLKTSSFANGVDDNENDELEPALGLYHVNKGNP